MGKESERSKKIRRGTGNALLATSVAVPAFFTLRGKLRVDRLKKLLKKSVVPLDQLEERTVGMASKNGKKIGRDLPGFYLSEDPSFRRRVPKRPISHGLTAEPGSEAERLIMKDRKEYEDLMRRAVDVIDGKEYEKIPVYTNKDWLVDYKTEGLTGLKKWKAKKMLDGPFFGQEGLLSDMSNPSFSPYISTGGYSSPNMLLHELGHAQAHRFNLEPEGPNGIKDMIKDVFAGLIHPGRTRKVRNETLAWDLAGVPKNDKIRRAALSTYTNNARATPAILLSSQLMPVGAGLRINTKENSPKSERKPRRSKMKKSSAYIAGFMSKCADCGVDAEPAAAMLKSAGQVSPLFQRALQVIEGSLSGKYTPAQIQQAESILKPFFKTNRRAYKKNIRKTTRLLSDQGEKMERSGTMTDISDLARVSKLRRKLDVQEGILGSPSLSGLKGVGVPRTGMPKMQDLETFERMRAAAPRGMLRDYGRIMRTNAESLAHGEVPDHVMQPFYKKWRKVLNRLDEMSGLTGAE